MRRFIFALLTFLALATTAVAAEPDTIPLTGNLAVDLGYGRPLAAEIGSDSTPAVGSPRSRKSPWLAGGLSALVPGAGQIYAEAPLWRTILYGAIEALGWTAWAVYDSKGDRATEDFERYADSEWDVTRYVDWIAANYRHWPDTAVDRDGLEDGLRSVYRSGDRSLPPWERVDFGALNKIERAVKGGFSHTLPEHGDQQYYEQIGKYAQYRAGWSDHRFDGDTNIYDPSRVTQRNRDYMDLRADANSYLGYASAALGIVVVNHLVSLVDAALQASHVNASVDGGLRGELLPDGRLRPVGSLELTVRF